MSIARVYRTKTVRKDWHCEKCGSSITKGVDGRISFAVGFRGREHTRCTRPGCYPTNSELDSSAVAEIYGAAEGIDYDSLESYDDLIAARDEVVAACESVAGEYEANEMYEINSDLQERAETVRSAGDDLSSWSPEGDEPEEDADCDECNGTGEVDSDIEGETEGCTECDASGKVDNTEERAEWLEASRDSLREAIDGMDLP